MCRSSDRPVFACWMWEFPAPDASAAASVREIGRLSATEHHPSSRAPPPPSTRGNRVLSGDSRLLDVEIERMSLIGGWEWSKVGSPGFWPEERGWCGVPRQL